MTEAVTAAEVRWWRLAVVGVAVVTFGVCVLSSSGAAAVGAGVPLAAFVACWLLFGGRALGGRPGWAVFGVVGVLVVACLIGTLASPSFAIVQVVAFPIAWVVPTNRAARFVANVAVAVAVGIGSAVHLGVPVAVVTQLLSLGFSLAIGTWITGIERRSQRRQELVEELTAAQTQVAALNREAGTAAERERLASELHDTLAQTLTGIVMLADQARRRHPADGRLEVLADAARQALGETRALVAAGAPVPLEGGLPGAFDALAGRFRRETGLTVSTEVGAEVPRGLEVVLLRCAQEALANVRKHANATQVALRLVEHEGEAVLTVEDDGRGPAAGDGFGLPGMRDRLALVDGDLELTRTGGGGALLTVRVPLAAAVAR